MSSAVLSSAPPQEVAAAPPMGDVLPPVKPKRGLIGFIRRNPTMAIGKIKELMVRRSV